jgi:hypothetical protein
MARYVVYAGRVSLAVGMEITGIQYRRIFEAYTRRSGYSTRRR